MRYRLGQADLTLLVILVGHTDQNANGGSANGGDGGDANGGNACNFKWSVSH